MTRAARTTRSLWKRVLLTLVVYSAGGLVLSLAVAWTIQNTTEPLSHRFELIGIADDETFVGVRKWSFGTETYMFFYMRQPIGRDLTAADWARFESLRDEVRERAPAWVRVPPPTRRTTFRQLSFIEHATHAFGWPMRSVRYEWRDTDSRGPPVYTGIRGIYRLGMPLELAYHAIPLGLAVNTLFYGGLAFAFVRTTGFIRRRVRTKRGRCARCGYDRAGLDTATPCPECGQF